MAARRRIDADWDGVNGGGMVHGIAGLGEYEMNRLNRWLRVLFIVTLIASFVSSCSAPSPTQISGEVEATEFQGKKLVPIKDQRNNALAGLR